MKKTKANQMMLNARKSSALVTKSRSSSSNHQRRATQAAKDTEMVVYASSEGGH
jgi:hypothetical protein